ncbi:hypothetical protein [Nonomuraea insulae]|uniref:Uncharacterized protein n=1 Tax=Nonomuraea insulae TaxID=1616787 RepID=A0ABW1CSV1_9ACTN
MPSQVSAEVAERVAPDRSAPVGAYCSGSYCNRSLANRRSAQEGNRYLERARDALPTIAVDPAPRLGDHFVGTIPQTICRQGAHG